MVFELDKMPEYTYDLSGTILVLKFDEKVDVNVSLVTEKLQDYIGVARRDPDGRAIRFALTSVFKINLTAVGTKLFLDLLPNNWVGMPPSLPKDVLDELSRAAEEAANLAEEEAKQLEESRRKNKLKIRVALHPTFSRLLFDWNRFATVNMSRNGNKVSLKFGRHADVDISQLKADPPPYLRKVAIVKNPKGVEIEFIINPEAKVRGFREGIDYVVDLSGPYADLDLSSEEAQKKIESRYKLKKLTEEEGKLDSKKLPHELNASDDKLGMKQGLNNKSKLKLDRPISVKALTFDPDSIKRSELGDLESDFGSDGEGFTYNQVWRGALKPGDLKKRKLSERKKGSQKEKDFSGGKGVEKDKPDQKLSKEKKVSDEVIVEAKVVKDNLELRIPFNEPIATAIFQRGRKVYVVLDTDKKIDIARVQRNSGGMVLSTKLLTNSGVPIIQIELKKKWLAYARLEDHNWSVAIGDMISGSQKRLIVKRIQQTDKSYMISVPYSQPGHVYWLKDSEIGDDIVVVTGFGPVRGFVKTQTFVEHQNLASAHGVVIKPLSDDVSIRLRLNEVLISRKGGLTISSNNVYQLLARKKPKKVEKKSLIGFIDFKNWQKGGPRFFARRLAQMEREIAFAAPKQKNKKRMQLARFFIAHQLSAEAMGVARQIVHEDATLANDPSFNTIVGAANVLMDRRSDARKALDIHDLAFDKNAALWRAYLAVREEDWPLALKQFSEGSEEISAYPPYMQARFRLLEAQAALAVKQWKRAATSLDAAPKNLPSKVIRSELELLKGEYFELIQKNDEALKSYKRVIGMDAGRFSARAELKRVNLMLRQKKIDDTGAIKALERLSIIWRGDETELKTLHRLADLYAKNKKYRKAFQIMKNTVIAFPKAQEALQIQDEMKDVFTDLFLYGKADSLPPVKALSLYYDYKELTPIGRLGDELIRRLAARLMSVDLLDQASELLDYQVKNRLNGIARAQVAARLALIHLMNRKPALALRSIRDTRQPDLPDELKRRRDILEARSLGEMGRIENTIDILSRLKGYNVARLRADAFWKAHRWQRSGELLEEMLGKRWRDDKPLSDTERFDVLRSAISYSLSDDEFALDRLRKKFFDKMKNGPDAESFMLVTSPSAKTTTEFTKLAKEIANVDTLQAFIKEYRDRFDRIEGNAKLDSDDPKVEEKQNG